MNFYQQKWIETLSNAYLPGWKISARSDDILIDMPQITDLKVIRDNIPETLAAMSLDITEGKHRLKFIFQNGYEKFEYLLNPEEDDLTEDSQ